MCCRCSHSKRSCATKFSQPFGRPDHYEGQSLHRRISSLSRTSQRMRINMSCSSSGDSIFLQILPKSNFRPTSLLFPQSFASENWPPVLIRTVKMCLGMCLAAQFQWDESQTIFEEVLSHNDERKGRNSADSLAISLQISEQVYR